MNRQESEALDRHITGNYGEDQFSGLDPDVPLFQVTCVVGEVFPGGEEEPALVAFQIIHNHSNGKGEQYTFPGRYGGEWSITAPYVKSSAPNKPV